MATKFQNTTSTDERWYFLEPGEVQPAGPIALSELRDRLENKKIHKKSIVWRKGMNQWEPIENVPQLKAKSFLSLFGFGKRAEQPAQPTVNPKN